MTRYRNLGSENDTFIGDWWEQWVVTDGGGDDVIVTGMWDDTIRAGDGNDIVNGGGGSDTIYGEGGNDRLRGGDGHDRVVGGDGNDSLEGGAGNDWLGGGSGHDVLFGDSGDDSLYGGSGNDRFYGGSGYNFIYGGDGRDTLLLNENFDSVMPRNIWGLTLDDPRAVVDLETGTANIVGQEGHVYVRNVLYDVEDVVGIDGGLLGGGDILRGSAGSNRIQGLGGDDLLDGRGGNDRLYGGEGRDVLIGGAGADHLTGGADGDVFRFDDGHSPVAQRDFIHDFETGLDTLDLSRIDANSRLAGDQAFSFVRFFTGSAGQLTIAPSTSGIVTVLGDVNGDRTADFAIDIFVGAGNALSLDDIIV